MKRKILSLVLVMAVCLGLTAPALASFPAAGEETEEYFFIERNEENELDNKFLIGDKVTLYDDDDVYTDCYRVISESDVWTITYTGADDDMALWVSLDLYHRTNGRYSLLSRSDWRQDRESGMNFFCGFEEENREDSDTVELKKYGEILLFSMEDFPRESNGEDIFEEDILYKLTVHLESSEEETAYSIVLKLDEEMIRRIEAAELSAISDVPEITASGRRDGAAVTIVVTVTGTSFDVEKGVNKDNWRVATSRLMEIDTITLSSDNTVATISFTTDLLLTSAQIAVLQEAFTDYSDIADYLVYDTMIVSGSEQTETDIPAGDDGLADSGLPANPETPQIPEIPDVPGIPDVPYVPSILSGSGATAEIEPSAGSAVGTDAHPLVMEFSAGGAAATDAVNNRNEILEYPNGSTVPPTVGTVGQVTAAVTIPAAAVAAAQFSGQTVALPIPEAPLTANASTAPTVTVTTGSAQPVKVEIPVERTNPGTVAVIVNADGTEEVVKTSLATVNGVILTVVDGATVKIVDNSKVFTDTVAHWASEAITFVAAHELFNGTGGDSFTPDGTMTRGMIVTVLARYAGVDTDSGAVWYEKGVEWAVANHISSGADLNAPVSREQLAVMLYRYAAYSGLDASINGALSGFADADSVSAYAVDAMAWAVGAGLISGNTDGTLAPQSSATRAEVAAILMRFCKNITK